MKLKDWSQKSGVKYLTAYRWFKAGTLPVKAYQTNSGTIIVDEELETEKEEKQELKNSAMSLFLKKTVEFSKNEASVEDFAAYVISNFTISLAEDFNIPKYSKQKPKSEDVQKHFQQFIPKNEKPKANSIVMEPEVDITITNTTISHEDLVNGFAQAVGVPNPPPGYMPTNINNSAIFTSALDKFTKSMSTESMINRNVDSNSTPQPINYTDSNNHAFSGSTFYSTVVNDVNSFNNSIIPTFTSAVVNNGLVNGIDNSSAHYLSESDATVMHDGLYPNVSTEPECKGSEKLNINSPRSKRGRKPSKK